MAQLCHSRRFARRSRTRGQLLRHAPNRGHMRPLWRPSRPRLPRRPWSNRSPLLHQLRIPDLHPRKGDREEVREATTERSCCSARSHPRRWNETTAELHFLHRSSHRKGLGGVRFKRSKPADLHGRRLRDRTETWRLHGLVRPRQRWQASSIRNRQDSARRRPAPPGIRVRYGTGREDVPCSGRADARIGSGEGYRDQRWLDRRRPRLYAECRRLASHPVPVEDPARNRQNLSTALITGKAPLPHFTGKEKPRLNRDEVSFTTKMSEHRLTPPTI